MRKEEEIWDDVIASEEEDTYTDKKKYKKYSKRLEKAIGHCDMMFKAHVFVEPREGQQDKIVSTPMDSKVVCDVELGRGSSFTCDSQENGMILSLVAQINERLKRVEQSNIELHKKLDSLARRT